MLTRSVIVLIGVIVNVLAGGCAGPSREAASSSTGLVASTAAVGSDLTGNWRGSFGEFAAHSRVVQGEITIQINDDLTFAEKWQNRPQRTGTVVPQGNHVAFRTASGSAMTLVRSGDTLYGTAHDPATAAVVMVKLERAEKADLVVTAVSDPPMRLARGDSFVITDTVENRGAATAAALKMTYYLSPNQSRSDADKALKGLRSVKTLRPGASSNGTVTLQVPRTTTPSRYYLVVCAVAENVISETDKKTNCATSATTLIVAP